MTSATPTLSERQEFEVAFEKANENCSYSRFFTRVIDDSRYESMEVEWGWRMWIARGFLERVRQGMAPST